MPRISSSTISPDGEVVVGCEVVIDEGAVLAQVREDLLRARDPVERQHLAGVRVHGGDELRLVEDPRLTCARARDRLDALGIRRRFGGLRRDRREVVLGRDRVVGREDVVDRTSERAGDTGGECGDERNEREADHQR
jgi:hypothetical protein